MQQHCGNCFKYILYFQFIIYFYFFVYVRLYFLLLYSLPFFVSLQRHSRRSHWCTRGRWAMQTLRARTWRYTSQIIFISTRYGTLLSVVSHVTEICHPCQRGRANMQGDNWPLPRRVRTCVGISNAKALGIVWRNITSHSMKNVAFHSSLKWKIIILPILATSLIHFLFKVLREWLFWAKEWKR